MTSEKRHEKARGRLAGPATAAIGASILLTIVIGLLGPSPMVPALTGPSWQPPYSLDVHPNPYLVIALAAGAIILGGLGLLTALTLTRSPKLPEHGALSSRLWTPPNARLIVLIGCTAAAILAFLPPSGSGDHLNYAAYGRMVTLGLSPYTHGAVDLPGDPIADAVEEPWREEPSVYGPVATAVQAVASWIGGDSLRLTIFVLALFNAAAFIATGLLIDRFTRDDPARRLRAALLWTANPLLLYQLVAGMHVDTLAIACMVAALLARSRPTGSGVLLGLGVAIKVNAGLVALGPAWELRRRPARLALMAACALAVVVIGYAIVGPEAIAPMTRTSKSISHASFWKLVQGWLQSIVGTGSAYRGEIQIGSLLVLALLAWSLLRLASRSRRPGLPPSSEAAPLPPNGPGHHTSPTTSHQAASEPGNATSSAVTHPPTIGPGKSVSSGASHHTPGRMGDVPPGAPSDDPRSGPGNDADSGGRNDADSATSNGAGRWSNRWTAPHANGGLEAPVVAAGLMVAYVFATPYILPWYDGLALGLLALVAASTVDRFVVAHLLVLSLAYLPARVEGQPEDLDWLREVVRPQLAWLLLALTAALALWAWRAARLERLPPAAAPARARRVPG